MGFTAVYDYEGGKMDWLAFGLPIEGSAAAEPTAGTLVRAVPTCRLDERVDEVAERLAAGDGAWCAVVDVHGVVLGRLRLRDLGEAPAGAGVREVMESGPSTYRPSLPAAELLEAMERGRFQRALVTDSAGRLLGQVERATLEAALRG